MDFKIIETDLLRLRLLGEAEYKYIFECLSDPEIIELLGLDSEEALQKEKAKYVRGYITFNKSFLFIQVLDKEGRHIGMSGFHTWYLDHARAEIFYILYNDENKGKGIMSEALPAIISYGFNEMKLNRIEAMIEPNNMASLKLVEKFNFSREGEMIDHYCKDGVMENSVIYGLLKTTYEKN
ncbi:N-acetyltransferase [Taibaiella sp. KBW10]|uniref:GNAT family N-acetyltransferase n=1 Tax=Taibaiella sp. KBW10 TaxID=2153357 RepID=UPI000F5903DF|nr:GNAT family protein [Taibaiella sp. KBW10]RQO30281.1 N-acetyltransferase [Taibaiella sp. KBW10]